MGETFVCNDIEAIFSGCINRAFCCFQVFQKPCILRRETRHPRRHRQLLKTLNRWVVRLILSVKFSTCTPICSVCLLIVSSQALLVRCACPRTNYRIVSIPYHTYVQQGQETRNFRSIRHHVGWFTIEKPAGGEFIFDLTINMRQEGILSLVDGAVVRWDGKDGQVCWWIEMVSKAGC